MEGWVGLLVGVGGLLTAGVSILRARSQNRVDESTSDSVDRAALTKAVETVQIVYEKTLGTIQGQVKELLDERIENRRELSGYKIELAQVVLREKECRAELETFKVVQKAQGLDIKDLKQKTEGSS